MFFLLLKNSDGGEKSIKFGGLKSTLWGDEKVQFRGAEKIQIRGAQKCWDEAIHNLHWHYWLRWDVENLS